MKTIWPLVPTLLISLCLGVANAQTGNVGIGTSSPDASAALDITSSNKGLLIPRLRETARTGMTAPAPGLLVYQTDGTQPGFWYYAGIARNAGWTFLNPNGDNLGSHTATQNLNLTNNLLVGGTAATPSASGLSINGSGNVGISVTNPTARLHVQGNTRIDQVGSVPAVDVSVMGSGSGVHALSTGGDGVWGISQDGVSAGVRGENTAGIGVLGIGGAGKGGVVGRTVGGGDGVTGSSSLYGYGVHGTTDNGYGVVGQASGTGTAGYFENLNANSSGATVYTINNGDGTGLYSLSTDGPGIYSVAENAGNAGVAGENTAGGDGVLGKSMSHGLGAGVHGVTNDGQGVYGESLGLGKAGYFVNYNGSVFSTTLEAVNSNPHWVLYAANIANAAGKGILTETADDRGGTALDIGNGNLAMSSTIGYTSGSIVDDPILIVKTTGTVTIPTGNPLINGTTVWVVNHSGGSLSVTNTTAGSFPISNGRAQQFLYVTSVSGSNWVPVQ